MSKNDSKTLGSIYGDILNQVKRNIVKESKMDIGEAPLKDGGPTKEGGFEEAEADLRKLKKNKENAYNLDKLSYPDHLEGEEDEENSDDEEITKDEEGEKNSQETEKIATESLNNFMRKKSIFDRYYAKVVNENYGMEMEETDDLDALGLDDATPDDEFDVEGEGGDEVTITLDRAMAQQFCDMLQSALGDDELDEMEGEDDLDEMEGADDMEGGFDEDEEGAPTAMSTSYNNGKSNKVGNLKPKGKASATSATGKVDPGSTHSGSYNDGKQNRVGNLKPGQGAFE